MVNGVTFGQRFKWDATADINAPQAFPRQQVAPAQTEPAPKKKHSALKVLGGLAIAAAATAAALALGSKFGVLKTDKIANIIPDAIKNSSIYSGEKVTKFIKEPAKKAIAGMDKAGEYILNNVTAGYGKVAEFVKGLFGKGTPAA